MRRAEHVGALGHEVHAAKDDELGVGVLADLPCQLVGIAGVVGEFDHLIALVVVAEDDEPAAQRRLGGRDAAVHFRVGESQVSLGQCLAFRDVVLFVLRQQRRK